LDLDSDTDADAALRTLLMPFAGGAMPPLADARVLFANARGRPVGVAVDRSGALLVADDVGNVIWRVTRAAAGTPASPALPVSRP
jgi:hypothetical protein